jgi:hypothetical protein
MSESKFIFKYVYDSTDQSLDEYANDKKVVVILKGEQGLTQIFNEFQAFLQSCGYVFDINDRIDKVNDFEDNDDSYDKESWDGPEHEPKESNHDDWNDGNEHVQGGEEGFWGKTFNFSLKNEDKMDTVPKYDDGNGLKYTILDGGFSFLNDKKIPGHDHQDDFDYTSGKDLPEELNFNQNKLEALKAEILPFLENLKKEPEKNMLHWPNRSEVIDRQIQRIKQIK